MTSDAKVGLLLGLLFIVVIAFLINGPSGFLRSDKPVIENAVTEQPGRTLRIDQAATEAARDLQVQAVPLRETEPPQEVQVLDPRLADLPAIAEEVPAVSQAASATVRLPSVPATAAVRTHTVQKGENLAVIAIQYYGKEMGNKRATVQKLFERNKHVLDSPDTVRVGDRLTIPSIEELYASSPRQEVSAERGLLNRFRDVFEPAAPLPSTTRMKYREYVVQPGDRLWDIAEQYMGDGKRYLDLVKLNREQIDDPDNVPAGIRLKIPVR